MTLSLLNALNRFVKVAAISFVAAAGYAYADNAVRYDYASLSWVNYDIANNLDADGFAFSGSYRLDEKFYVEGLYQDIESDIDISSEVFGVGLGYIYPYQHMDIYGQFSFLRSDVDGVDSEAGYQIEAGARGYIEPQLGVYAGVNFVDIDGTDTYLNLGADYYFNYNYSVGAEITVGGDADLLALHARLHFK